MRINIADLEVMLDATGIIQETPFKIMPKGLLQARRHHCTNGIPTSIGHGTLANFEQHKQ